MEHPQELPDFKEVYELYAERRPDKKAEVENKTDLSIENPTDLEKGMCDFAEKIEDSFESTTSNDPKASIREEGNGRKVRIPLGEEVIDDSIPITISAHKILASDYPHTHSIDSVVFNLYKGQNEKTGEFIGNVHYTDQNTGFELNHRYLENKFKKLGFGSMLLRTCEAFLKKLATQKQEILQSVIQTAQLDVIYWCWKNGYRPEETQDWEKLQAVLNGDENLYLLDRYYIFDKNRGKNNEQEYHDDRTEPDGSPSINYRNAYRLNFVKNVNPEQSKEIRGIMAETHHKFM